MTDFLTRRKFNEFLVAAGAAAALGPAISPFAAQAAGGRVVIIGGGFGGATCANYIKRYASGVEVTLIEKNAKYVTCPFSNTVLGGLNDMDFITRGYSGLSGHGINVLNDMVTAIDPAGKKVSTKGGKSIPYDALIVSPGISFRWDQINGYDEAASQTIPHAWQAGAQTEILKKQLEGMADGGVVIISTPKGPMRAPPAPYERASMIANYLKNHKPKSKVLLLDSADSFEELDLYEQGWKKLYPDMIERVKGSQVVKVDVAGKTVTTAGGQTHKGSVINLIPPQQAGAIALAAGLAGDDGWCPVNQGTFESVNHNGVYVIGDSCIAGDMPKAGSAANTQAKVCVAAILSALTGAAMPKPAYGSVFYSLVGKRWGISSVGVYRLEGGKIKMVSGGPSPLDASKKVRSKEAKFAAGWYKAITGDTFG